MRRSTAGTRHSRRRLLERGRGLRDTATRAALMVGTSGAIRTVYEPSPRNRAPGLFLYRVDETRVVEGGSLSDGGNLYAWLEQTLKEPPAQSLADRAPGAHGLTFLPLLGGERSPGWHQHAKGAVHGADLRHDAARPAPGRARRCRVPVRGDRGPAARHVEVVATGAALLKDPDWVQIMADVLGRPITTSAVPEASLRGAAVVVLERLGETPAPAPLASTVEPRPDKAGAFRAARERQRRLYDVVTSEPTS